MILRNRLPAVQSFLRPARLSASAAGFVCRLILTFCCHLGRNSASQAASLPRCDPRHPAAVGRFLGRQRWAKGDWMAPLRADLLSHELASGGPFFFLLDQTCSSRQGQKTPNTFSTGNRSRRPRRGRRYTNKKNAPKRCHALVCGLLLTPGGLRIPYRRSYYTHEYCQQNGLLHRTQAERGADLIRDLELPPAARVVVLGDTAYEADSVQRACAARGFSWITPGNPQRVLAGKKPRPKVRSLLEQVSRQRFVAVQVHPDSDPYAAQRRWSASAPDRSKRGRTYWVCRQRLQVHSVGEVLAFVSTTKKPQRGQPLQEPKILLSNDLDLTAREAVLRYTLRWQIELFFKECKSVLGMVQYRFGDFGRVERWVDLALATYLYLEWHRQRRLRRPRRPPKERAWRQAQRTAGLCRAVRCERDEKELQWLARRLATPGGCRRLRRLLRAGLPRDLRASRPAA